MVKRSSESDIVYFTQKIFNPDDFAQHIQKSVLFTKCEGDKRHIYSALQCGQGAEAAASADKGHVLYMRCAGTGEGLCGSEGNKTPSPARGSVKVSRKVSLQGDKGSEYVCEKIRSQVRQTVIENSGRITQFG